MPLIAATNIAHAFGTRIILDGATLSIEAGERVGIVGRNGQGKSTLMKAMAGVFKPDSGDIAIARGARIGYLQQDPDLDPNETLRGAAEAAFAELHQLHIQLNAVFDQMAGPAASDPDELEKLMKKQERLEAQIEAAGGYAIDHKIDAVLHGLGFTDGQFSVPVGSLSGGQKARLSLARLLLENPDVILLDEPTNHLDLDGRLWLEAFLKNDFQGAVVMIAHDRYLLDHVVTRIVEVEQGRLIDYPAPKGDAYQTFRRLRAERKLVQMRSWEAEQTKFKAEERFIQRYKAGQRAKQAKGRETRLEREKASSTIERPMELGVFRFNLPKSARASDIVAKAQALTVVYDLTDERGAPAGQKALFRDLDLTISRGERWGLLGPNGAGKSTLIKCLLGEMQPTSGTVRLGSNLSIGYFSQSAVGMDPDTKVYRYLQGVILKENPSGALSEQQARDLAGAFLFSGEEQEAEIRRLSGGEKGRARLAGLLASAKNVLILDEPTNHLDIESSERLEAALALPIEATSHQPGRPGGEWEGTMLLISHDRAIIDACCNKLLILDGQGNHEIFDGNYTQWAQAVSERESRKTERDAEARRLREAEEKRQRAQIEKKQQEKKQDQPKPRSQNAMSLMSQGKLEAEIERIEKRIAQIDKEMAEPDVWSDHRKMTRLGDERAKLAAQLEPLEFEWMSRAAD